jgi:hypothetical protein
MRKLEETAFAVEHGPIVTEFFLGQEENLPLVIRPFHDQLEIGGWMAGNKEWFEKKLRRYGAILFRGFGIKHLDDFHSFLRCFNTDPLPYMFRSSPREEIDKNVRNIYRSTSYPQDRAITLHNESSYSRVWGKAIIFCCVVPAAEGGETPIADSRRILHDIDPALVEKFRQRGVRYWRNISPDVGMPWQEVFQTTSSAELADICRKYAITHSFEEDRLILEWNKPAVYAHPVTGDDTWFNHVFFFNKYTRYKELGVDYEEDIPREYLSSDTMFGDGEPISIDEYRSIERAYDKNTIYFPYCKGDILFLDNMLTAHGRNPYKGDRTIATAIIEAMSDKIYQD